MSDGVANDNGHNPIFPGNHGRDGDGFCKKPPPTFGQKVPLCTLAKNVKFYHAQVMWPD